ncbi:GNAT family N-acetyltransferase [Deinococcus sonorensis]|uniref:GNAT family N-acetyltransferase n=2 Tax=Deinococcus sonorensis TaxID=309891 RepID=A0AAU7U5G6_9DEIO
MPTTLSADTALSLIEGNLRAFWRLSGTFPGFTLREHPGSFSVTSGLPFPLFNVVLPHAGPVAAEPHQLEVVLDQMRQAGAPFLFWTLPSSPPGLSELLIQQGLNHVGTATGMVIDLTRPLKTLAPPAEVVRVLDDALVQAYLQVLSGAFGLPERFMDFTTRWMESFGIRPDSDTPSVVAFMDGQPVGCATMSFGAGTAGIYNVGVLEPARRRGVGALMTRELLALAVQRGVQTAILHSTPMGLNMYTSLGFEPHGDVGQYLWLPDPAGMPDH